LRGGPVWRPSRVGWPSRTCARCPEGSVAHTRLNAGSWPFPLPALTLAVLLSQRAGLCGSCSRRVRGWARRVAPRGLRLSLEDTSAPCCLRPRSWRAESPAPTEAGARSDARSGDARSSDSSHGVRLKDAPPSTSAVRVRSQLAVVLDWRGVLRTGHAVRRACAHRSAATSLRAFGPGQPDRDIFRPCRFSRLRRLAPRTRRRSVAPCSRSWGSPGCGPALAGASTCLARPSQVRSPFEAFPSTTADLRRPALRCCRGTAALPPLYCRLLAAPAGACLALSTFLTTAGGGRCGPLPKQVPVRASARSRPVSSGP
jgi:hypothetical protein